MAFFNMLIITIVLLLIKSSSGAPSEPSPPKDTPRPQEGKEFSGAGVTGSAVAAAKGSRDSLSVQDKENNLSSDQYKSKEGYENGNFDFKKKENLQGAITGWSGSGNQLNFEAKKELGVDLESAEGNDDLTILNSYDDKDGYKKWLLFDITKESSNFNAGEEWYRQSGNKGYLYHDTDDSERSDEFGYYNSGDVNVGDFNSKYLKAKGKYSGEEAAKVGFAKAGYNSDGSNYDKTSKNQKLKSSNEAGEAAAAASVKGGVVKTKGAGGSKVGGDKKDGGKVDGGKKDEGNVYGGKKGGGKVDGGKVDGGKVDGGKKDEGNVYGGKKDGGSVDGGKKDEGKKDKKVDGSNIDGDKNAVSDKKEKVDGAAETDKGKNATEVAQ